MKKRNYFIGNGFGFTLIELLVAIAIVGTLASSLFFTLNPVGQFAKAHDTQRKNDLEQVRNALETYYNDNNRFPTTQEALGVLVLGGYLSKEFKDPLGTSYCYQSDDNNSYLITAKLERSGDPQALPSPGIICQGTSYNYALTVADTSAIAVVPPVFSPTPVVPTSTSTPIPTLAPTLAPTPVPHPPTGTISGPVSIILGKSGTYTATVNDADSNQNKAIVYVEGSPAGRQNWTKIKEITCSGSPCTTTVNWTPISAGTYTVVVNGFDNTNYQCSGNPYYSPYCSSVCKGGYTRCGAVNTNAGAYITITVAAPTPIPTPKLANGQACSAGGQCQSTFCVDGYCCNSTCTGKVCQTCGTLSKAGKGTCSYINSGSQDPDNECTASYNACSGNNRIGPDGYCSGTGYSCKTTGLSSACAIAGTCQTGGGCIGGYCQTVSSVTNNAQVAGCNGTCQACQGGQCSVATVNTDPGEHCSLNNNCGIVVNNGSSQSCTTKCSGYTKTSGLCNSAGGCAAATTCSCSAIGTNTYPYPNMLAGKYSCKINNIYGNCSCGLMESSGATCDTIMSPFPGCRNNLTVITWTNCWCD